VGYSGGGASSLAFAAQHGERLLSLALLEPAWAGNDRTEAEDALWLRFRALEQLPPDELMAAFVGLQLATSVEPPPRPEGPPPPWMAKRPAGIRAFIDAFDSGDLDLDALRAFDRPVYFALGGRSNPDYYGRMADRLSTIFPDFTIETFPERHHFDPPQRIEPEHVADSLLALWRRAESKRLVRSARAGRGSEGIRLPTDPRQLRTGLADTDALEERRSCWPRTDRPSQGVLA
jgi:pimeloyl-ACP methyl ester carboxylesterase